MSKIGIVLINFSCSSSSSSSSSGRSSSSSSSSSPIAQERGGYQSSC